MNLHIFQHVPFEWIGGIESWAARHGHSVTATRFFEAHALPNPNTIDLLVIMGGPMGVHDEKAHPWLADEKKFLYEYVHNGQKALGICLGAQLLADVLGAHVTRNPEKELGWFPVTLTTEGTRGGFMGTDRSFHVFHWHQDTFSLPRGAVPLARSEACENQAFLRGKNVLGLQFHIEMGPEEAADVCSHCAGELEDGGPFVQSAEEIRALGGRFAESCRRRLHALLDRFSAL